MTIIWIMFCSCCCIIRVYMCKPIQINRQLRCSGTNVLLTSDFSSSTRGVRHNSYYANNTPKIRHISWSNLNFSTPQVGPQLQLSASVADNPTVCLYGPKSTPNRPFFKIIRFSRPSLPGMTSFTLQPYFLSGVYYDNCDCHILCARAQNCTKSRIVQSPTKLNDKI